MGFEIEIRAGNQEFLPSYFFEYWAGPINIFLVGSESIRSTTLDGTFELSSLHRIKPNTSFWQDSGV